MQVCCCAQANVSSSQHICEYLLCVGMLVSGDTAGCTNAWHTCRSSLRAVMAASLHSPASSAPVNMSHWSAKACITQTHILFRKCWSQTLSGDTIVLLNLPASRYTSTSSKPSDITTAGAAALVAKHPGLQAQESAQSIR